MSLLIPSKEFERLKLAGYPYFEDLYNNDTIIVDGIVLQRAYYGESVRETIDDEAPTGSSE